MQIGEHRPHRVLQHQGVPLRTAGGGHEHRHVGQRPLRQHVEEGLEQSAERGVEGGRHRDHAVGPCHRLERLLQRAGGEPGQHRVRDRPAQRPQLHERRVDALPLVLQRRAHRGLKPVGQEPGRGRLPQAPADDRQIRHRVTILRPGGVAPSPRRTTRPPTDASLHTDPSGTPTRPAPCPLRLRSTAAPGRFTATGPYRRGPLVAVTGRWPCLPSSQRPSGVGRRTSVRKPQVSR